FAPNYPIIGDTDLKIAQRWGMLPASAGGDASQRTASDNQAVRTVFVVGPDKKIKLILVYPMTTGRNFDELLRVIDSLHLAATHKVATPVNWQQGEDVIIVPSMSDARIARRSRGGQPMSLARDITTVGGATLASRLLGFARDMAIAALLGAGAFSDA